MWNKQANSKERVKFYNLKDRNTALKMRNCYYFRHQRRKTHKLPPGKQKCGCKRSRGYHLEAT